MDEREFYRIGFQLIEMAGIACLIGAGDTRTPMLAQLDPERVREIVRPHAIKRLCEPHEVAEAVAWLASDRSSLVTGVAFRADLGLGAGVAG